MRNRFTGSRHSRRPDRPGKAPSFGSPYDFGSRDDDGVDPIDLLAIRADDEMLDALSSGRMSFSGFDSHSGSVPGNDLDDDGFGDDQRMLALLGAWREEVLDEPIPELVSIEEASEAIVTGHRAGQPRRRLMPVAAAAAVVVFGLSGVALGAGSAEPGDALWGVSKTLDGDRAASVEAAQRVSVALASVREALAEGRVAEAQVTLASVAPELDKVTDADTKEELARMQANLSVVVEEAEEGEKVKTDDSGKRDQDSDTDSRRGSSGQSSSPSKPSDASKSGSTAGKGAGPSKSESGSSSPGQGDPRRAGGPATPPSEEPSNPSSAASDPQPDGPGGTKPEDGKQDPPPQDPAKPAPTKPEPGSTEPSQQDPAKDDPNKPDPNKPDSPNPEPKGQGEGAPAQPPAAQPPAPAPAAQPAQPPPS